jgi:hypothetical protein
MNALEKIEKLEKDFGVVSQQLLDLQSALTKVLPVVDGLIAVVGREPVLKEAQRILDETRKAQIEQAEKDLLKQVEEGTIVEDTESRESSLLFVDEKKTDAESGETRLLPIGSVAEENRAKFVGLKVGDTIPTSEGFEVKVLRIFSPVTKGE